MEITRRATPDDAPAIRALGLTDEAFQVSERIPFYELEELIEWSTAPRDNLLFVSETSGRLTGFFFCKVMSQHWAMLDNFYVVPESRASRTVRLLRAALLEALQTRGITYLSTLVALDDPALERQLQRFGFRAARTYEWLELFVADQVE